MKKKEKKILVVEDDPFLGMIVKDCFDTRGYQATLCDNGEKGLSSFMADTPSICILDVMMPKKDGFTLAEEIRRLDKNVPLLFLTAKSQTEDVLKGFSLGAHDYVKKPFSMEELIVRVEGILKRQSGSATTEAENNRYELGGYVFDYNRLSLTYQKEEEKNLTPREAELLKLFCENLNQTVNRRLTLQKLWGDDSFFNGRSMDVFIAKLRKYLSKEDRLKIINIRGEGYKLVYLPADTIA